MMEDSDKPFACHIAGCGMHFVNEDHLTVHKKKHEMSLSFNSANILKDTFVDQTPTPTKLIRNCLDVGLFQELGLHANPFDEQFRKAAQSGTLSVSSMLMDQGSLNTPSIQLMTADVQLSVSSSTDNLHDSGVTPRMQDSEPVEIEETMPFAPSNTASVSSELDGDLEIQSYDIDNVKNQSVPMLAVKPHKDAVSTAKSKPRQVVQMPVITSAIGGVQRQISSKGKSSTRKPMILSKAVSSTTSGQPIILNYTTSSASVASSASIATSAIPPSTVIRSVPSSSSAIISNTASGAPVIQLIVKVDGQSMPFNIPISSLASGIPNSNTLSTSALQSERVKEALKGNMVAKMAKKGVYPASVKSGHSSQVGLLSLKQPTHNSVSGVITHNPVATVQPTVRTSFNPGKRRDPDDDDPQEKRRRFLERNRAAATRCRQKKKQWVDELEKKCMELSKTNSQLHKEVASLRNEVAHLKTMLLAHKDCPVTQQQRTNGQPEYISLSAFTSINPVCTSGGSSPNLTSFRTLEGSSHSNGSPVLLQTIELEVSDCSIDNSNDDSVPGSSDF